MIIKFSLVRLSIIYLLVILFPLVQKQWLNLYLFDINNFTIYKFLYYLSGFCVPILVIINSLYKFTYYKFNYHQTNRSDDISGKFLFVISLIVLIILSTLIVNYIYINLKLLLDLFISNNEYLFHFDIYKQIFFIVIISTLLIFKKTKYLVKKLILINYFIFSIVTWYSQIDNSFLIDIVPFYIYKFGNINFINIAFLLAIETVFYLWSYISYRSNLSDWKVQKPLRIEALPILNIVMFYLSIIFYYSILLK